MQLVAMGDSLLTSCKGHFSLVTPLCVLVMVSATAAETTASSAKL